MSSNDNEPQLDESTKKEPVNQSREEAVKKVSQRKKERTLVRRIVFTIVAVVILLMGVVGYVGYHYIKDALQPVDPDSETMVEVEIPLGTSTKGIAEILEYENLIHDAAVFNYYLKFQNVADFQAGFYELSAGMDIDEIISELKNGGNNTPSSQDNKILVVEGATATEIAAEVEEKTDITAEEFLAKLNDEAFLDRLIADFPDLLSPGIKNDSIRYALEGYLYPATYDYLERYTVEDIIYAMVEKANEEFSPYKDKIAASPYSLHELLTLASLVEKEGSTPLDRAEIAGVFFNRLEADMMLQSDISVLYALDEHKESVTIEDTQVDSPYNLYQNKGVGPGPFNSPSVAAFLAVLNPKETANMYFVADLDTGEVYFAETFEEHLQLQEQYVDNE